MNFTKWKYNGYVWLKLRVKTHGNIDQNKTKCLQHQYFLNAKFKCIFVRFQNNIFFG